MRKSLRIVLAVMIVAVGAPNVHADTTFDLNLPGISSAIPGFPGLGDVIPIESFMINPSKTTELFVIREVDGFSPELFDATVTGVLFATGSVDTFDSSFSTTTPITSFVMTDIFLTSIQHSGSSESVTLDFAAGTFVSNVPEPSSLMLLGSGLLSLAGIKRRRSGC